MFFYQILTEVQNLREWLKYDSAVDSTEFAQNRFYWLTYAAAMDPYASSQLVFPRYRNISS
jgi:hypothetical protein